MRVLPEYARFLIFDLPLLEDMPKIGCHDLWSFYHANIRIHTKFSMYSKFSTKFSWLKNLRWLVKRSVLLSVRLTLVTPKTQFSLCQNGPELLYCAVIYVRGLRMYTEYKLQILTRMHDACTDLTHNLKYTATN